VSSVWESAPSATRALRPVIAVCRSHVGWASFLVPIFLWREGKAFMKPFNLRRRIAVLLLLGVWCLMACGQGEVEQGTPASESMGAVLPAGDVFTGWEMVSQPESYGPENLWDYINGQAEFYLNYGFIRVDAAEYRADGGSPSVVVEIYQMASPEEAFGIFAAERNPDDRSIDIGSGGYLGSNVLNFWQGNSYLKLISFEAGDANEDALMDLAREISARIPAGSGLPEFFSYFPDEGRIEASERFFPRSFLGQADLDRVYRVDYSLNSTSFQLFLGRFDSNSDARAALARYSDFMRSQGRRVELVDGESSIMVSESGMATVVFVFEGFLGGVLDAATLKDGRIAADGLAQRLSTAQ